VSVYVVPGAIVRVISAGRLDVNLDLGWGIWKRHAELRLEHVSHLPIADGRLARRFLCDQLGELPRPCIVTSRRIEEDGCAICSIYVDGIGDLSQLLLAAGVAAA
jgi:hypothetical protein